MNKQQFAACLENRIYHNDVDYPNIRNLCYEAIDFGFPSVQIFPSAIRMCRETIGSHKVGITSVIAYPHGSYSPEMKYFEISDAVRKGADGVAVVLNTIELKSGHTDYTRREMEASKKAADGAKVMYLIQTEFLLDREIEDAVKIAVETGVDGIITSTGNYNTLDENKNDVPIKTTAEEIRLIKSISGGKLLIQAQGNIDSVFLAKELLACGADIIGTRFASDLYKQF